MGGVKASSEFDEANFSTTHKVVKELTIEFGKNQAQGNNFQLKRFSISHPNSIALITAITSIATELGM